MSWFVSTGLGSRRTTSLTRLWERYCIFGEFVGNTLGPLWKAQYTVVISIFTLFLTRMEYLRRRTGSSPSGDLETLLRPITPSPKSGNVFTDTLPLQDISVSARQALQPTIGLSFISLQFWNCPQVTLTTSSITCRGLSYHQVRIQSCSTNNQNAHNSDRRPPTVQPGNSLCRRCTVRFRSPRGGPYDAVSPTVLDLVLV